MATRAEIRSDIELRLTKGKPSDDLELDPRQIDFWIDIVRNKLTSDLIKANGGKNNDISASSGVMLDPIKIQKLTIDQANVSINQHKYYIDIPGGIMSLPNDAAIVDVKTMSGSNVNRIRITDLAAVLNIYTMRPSPNNMMFYRVGKRLFIIGPTKDFLDNGHLNVVVIPSTTESIADNDEYPIHDELVPILLDAVEAIARRQFQLPQDLISDGIQ